VQIANFSNNHKLDWGFVDNRCRRFGNIGKDDQCFVF
jgi:hypothetical protein